MPFKAKKNRRGKSKWNLHSVLCNRPFSSKWTGRGESHHAAPPPHWAASAVIGWLGRRLLKADCCRSTQSRWTTAAIESRQWRTSLGVLRTQLLPWFADIFIRMQQCAVLYNEGTHQTERKPRNHRPIWASLATTRSAARSSQARSMTPRGRPIQRGLGFVVDVATRQVRRQGVPLGLLLLL